MLATPVAFPPPVFLARSSHSCCTTLKVDWQVSCLYQHTSVMCACAVVQVLGLVYTFGTGRPGVQALVLTLLCIAYGVTHATVAPMRSSVVGVPVALNVLWFGFLKAADTHVRAPGGRLRHRKGDSKRVCNNSTSSCQLALNMLGLDTADLNVIAYYNFHE